MDEVKVPAAFSRTRHKTPPKGVISINRKKPKIEKYDDSPLVFSSQFVPIDSGEQQIEMPHMEE